MTWMTGTYDPDLNLLYWGTGNPTPVLTGTTRPGHNLVHLQHRRSQSRYRQTRLVISSLRRTTRTIGMPLKRPFWPMPISTAAPASC